MTDTGSISQATPHPRSHIAKRLSVLEAASIVFCRDGFASASLELIAAEAGVSRQTIYNHYGDKEKLFIAVVKDLTERANAGLFAAISSFPDNPADLEAELVDFAMRLACNCMCNNDCIALRKLIQAEGRRYPELFAPWRELGPERAWTAIGARFARLHHAGYLEIDDPDIAARQFQALVNSDLYIGTLLGDKPSEAQVRKSAAVAVKTFLKAYGATAAKH
ncbi:TetR/AcrR family transcriptional regulator C-terminal domain-containing protein [Taklimakanibacter lacteus]|uniref:TetR/AcrR family transcriptional regulator C-terminal domain-containing protein n=1 Tax=Taklimakanibacter lacteus TaxID=2268456 RepID=UPI000E66ADAF